MSKNTFTNSPEVDWRAPRGGGGSGRFRTSYAPLPLGVAVADAKNVIAPPAVNAGKSATAASAAPAMPAPVFVDEIEFPYCREYYAMFPRERLSDGGWLPVAGIVPLGPGTFDTLLESIATKASQGSNVVIVGHATAGGLTMKLTWGNAASAGTKALKELLAGEDDGQLQDMTSAERAIMRGNVAKIRKLRLNRVEIRSCNLGVDDADLKPLLELFGAKSVSAPTLVDFFGCIDPGNPTTDPETWKKWQQRFRQSRMWKYPSGRVAMTQFPPEPETMADSWDAVRAWISECLGTPVRPYMQGRCPVHALAGLADGLIFPQDVRFPARLKRLTAG